MKPDHIMRPIIERTMKGNMIINDGETEESIIDEYFNHRAHTNYIIDDEVNGYLCVTEYEDYVVVNFAWHIGKFSTLKKMVRLAKSLHTVYSINFGLPMYYSGKTNLYPNHSITIDNNVWQFIG